MTRGNKGNEEGRARRNGGQGGTEGQVRRGDKKEGRARRNKWQE